MTDYPKAPLIEGRLRIWNLRKENIRVFQIGTDHLWLVAIFACILTLISLVPLIPNDFWWHLKVGEIIYLEHRIPTTNLFAWSIPADRSFTYAAWLAEYLFYLVYRMGRLESILFLRTLLAAVTFGLLASEAKRRGNSWRLAAGAVALAGLMILNNQAIRPQIWSWLPFMAYLMILSRYIGGQLSKWWLFLLPMLMVFWVNMHGAFILGIALIGAYLGGEVLARVFKMPAALPWNRIGWLGLAGVLTLMAVLINPQGMHIFGYVVKLMTDPPSQGLIEEWRSPTPQGISNITFFVSILLLLVGSAYSRYRPRVSEMVMIAGLLWLAWSGQRYVIWYALAVTPLLAEILANLPFRFPRLRSSKNRLNLALAAALMVPVLMVQSWFVERLPLAKIYGDSVIRGSPLGPLMSWSNPVGAADYLLAHPGGHLFNEMGYGSYLIWALPAGSVFIDPRVELYPLDQWQDYLSISHAVRYEELLDKYGADRILLDKELQTELAAALALDGDWSREYDDQRAQVWRKR